MDPISDVINENDIEDSIPTTIEETIHAPPPSPSHSNVATTISESESPVHLVKMADVDEEINQNTFNEIESELVQLNLSSPIVVPPPAPPSSENSNDMDVASVTYIKESIKMDVDTMGTITSAAEKLCENQQSTDMDEIPLNEEPDTLSPLLIDNHTHVQHQEMLVNGHYYTPHDEATTRTLNPLARSFMRQRSGEPDSFESISDSDVSMSFDRNLKSLANGASAAAAATRLPNAGTITNALNGNDTAYDTNNSSDEYNKDSGCEYSNSQKTPEDEGPIEIPDDETCEKIVEQVEFYFSNESLLKDAFLLKHVRRNKEGFVSLKLVSSFKRVRQICKDWRAVGYAIKKASKMIELNDISTKIRRLEPLPDYDETLPSRTIVATGFPFEKLTIEKVSDIFSKCGEIALVRVLRPGGQIPADVRQFMNKHPELLENECALVEFTESAAARVAQQMEGLYVLELVLPKKKTGKKANVTKLVENLKYNSESDNERNRGGEINRYQLKRNNSAFYVKPEQNGYVPPPRRMSFGNEPNNAFEHFQNKRFNNMQNIQSSMAPESVRRYSGCSDGYGSCNEMSRRSSLCSSELSRRYSNCSDAVPQLQQPQHIRRYSNCSEVCSCHRRGSQSSDVYRRISQTSGPNDMSRKYSTASSFSTSSNGFERRFSNASDMRRISVDSSNGFESHSPRRYSNGFDPFRKLSSSDQYYINGRRISTDSGYDRRLSFSSDVSGVSHIQQHQHNSSHVPASPIMVRGRSGSLFNDNVVRTPMGPDGSKGFTRARRFGQVVPPIQ